MIHIKKFESIFDIFKQKSNDKEVRISLDEEMFSSLCDNGFITYGGDEVPINQSKFTDLIGGEIILVYHSGKNYKIILKDIGINKILEYTLNSEIYH